MIRILASIPAPAQVNAGFSVGSIAVTSGAVLTLIEPQNDSTSMLSIICGR